MSASALVLDFHPNIRQETETDPLPEEILTLRSPGGITEIVTEKHWRRYQGWKDEFLSTETGRVMIPVRSNGDRRSFLEVRGKILAFSNSHDFEGSPKTE